MRTFFQDFKRDDGSPITVEYGVEGSYSPTTYSPHSGACGGDAPEFGILKAWHTETEATVTLTDAENERILDWLAENYVEEPDDFEDDYR